MATRITAAQVHALVVAQSARIDILVRELELANEKIVSLENAFASQEMNARARAPASAPADHLTRRQAMAAAKTAAIAGRKSVNVQF